MSSPAILNVDHIGYAYGPKKALDGVSFEVHEGQCAILLGPNGAGKSTLFSLITHLYDAPSGAISILGHDIRREPLKALKSLGVVFQQSTLDLDLTVRQNLLYHAALHGISRREANHRIDEELTRLGMLERANEKARQLNGGHRRRVEIARALLHHPKLLLLDEPTVGLDVPSRKALVDHIHTLCRERRLAVLWATHLIDEIAPQDQLIILHQGRVRAFGAIPKVLGDTGYETIEAAFQALTGKKETASC